jgi:phage tail sheath protein FI
MATSYKTPGVYVEEIPKFPPSIAPVETAIPAFIGYTEKAERDTPGDLLNVPTKIGSIAEYEELFGEGAAPKVESVILDDNKNFKLAEVGNTYYMYDSLRLFYANGGGDCYIVSTGGYTGNGKLATDFTDSDKALARLQKEDEPTILVFPDNSLLTTGDEFYAVYEAALAQCGDLMDRVGLFHVKQDDPQGGEFRSKTGTKALKYGAVYTPWLKVIFPKAVTYRDLKDEEFADKIYIGTTRFSLSELTEADDTETKSLISGYETSIADTNKITAASVALAASKTTLRDRFTELDGAYLTTKTAAKFKDIVKFLFDIARQLDILVGSDATKAVGNDDLKNTLKTLIMRTLKGLYTDLISHDLELADAVGTYDVQYNKDPVPSADAWGEIFGAEVPEKSAVIPAEATTDKAKMNSLLPYVRTLFDKINVAWLGTVEEEAKETEKEKHEGLSLAFPLYKTILTGIQNASTIVPPAGAVAGIYAYVDRTRGVWKAPANVSISSIIGPTETFTQSETDALNVNATSGKSINAIRRFTGKGTMVYGARTLAGNDNEWRYINVRRFFNFVEESCKKATEQFVFEPNDANTWVKVQAMIENFLTVLWRQGALQGSKPEQAFYVAVGLGKTMTALDILEGRMIIEIGMAAVRPAEFIILRFSHKMVEA